MAEWQPIETAPKDGTIIDLWFGEYRETDCWWQEGCSIHPQAGWYSHALCYGYGDWFDESEQPTHWMPLPAPPESPQ